MAEDVEVLFVVIYLLENNLIFIIYIIINKDDNK
jgi:hypothetical protein